LEETDDKQKFASKRDLYEEFSRWSQQTKLAKNVDDSAFSQAMKRKGYKDDVVKQKGKATRVWVGSRISTLVERGMGQEHPPNPEDVS
jgi:hypothetical protein